MQETLSPLRIREGIPSNALERREFLKLATIGGVSLSCVGQAGEALAQRETPRGKITPTHMPEELLRDGIPLSDGGIATVEDCPAAGAEQRLIILRYIHPVAEPTPEEARLIARSRKELGEVMKFLLDNYGVNCCSLEGFTDREYFSLRKLLAKKNKGNNLTDEEQSQLDGLLKSLKRDLPAGAYDLFRKNKIFMLPGESDEASEASHKLTRKLGKHAIITWEEEKIISYDREDSCLDIAHKSRMKIIETVWGADHFSKLDNGKWGDLPRRILNRNIRDFGMFSAAFVTTPIVIEEFKKSKKEGELNEYLEYVLENH